MPPARVILAAGAFNSPVLQLSASAPGACLQSFGIDVIA
jgi:hypothetical protein